MSAPPPTSDPDTQPIVKIRGSSERKRAAVVLGVLAVVAVLVVGVMIYALGSSGGSSKPATVANPSGPPVTVTGGATGTSSRSATATTATTRPSTTPRSTPARTGPVSCPTSAPCALPDDVGDAVAALNAFRASHHAPAVTGTVTKTAQKCALSNGDDCPGGFYWEPVERSGSQVIDKIGKSGKGTGWLTDKAFTKVQVGWAYVPSSKSFECALISNA